MPKKHTYEFVKEKIESLGGKLLSKEYHGNSQKLEIICGSEHNIKINFASIQHGNWCKECSNIRNRNRYALKYDFVKSEIEKRGGVLISQEYINDSTKLNVVCSSEHSFYITYDSVRAGYWCKECGINKVRKKLAYSFEFVKEKVESLGGILVSTEYTNCKEKLSIICSVGHAFNKTFDSIMSGEWCKQCSIIVRGERIAHSYDFVKSEVEKRGGILITKGYKNASTELEIICGSGHTFYTDYGRINQGMWCKSCAIKKSSHSYEFIKSEVEKRGGILITKEYINTSQKLEIICEKNHTFNISYHGINHDNWCAECSLRKTQRKLQNILESLLQQPALFNYKGFDWLRNPKTNRKLEIDLWFPALKLAVEYDGEQHFRPVVFNGNLDRAKKNLKGVKYRDRLKNKLIKQHPNDVQYFVRFSHKESITEPNIKDKLTVFGVL